MTYGNLRCGLETHTALGCASCCMGLLTTPLVPINHVLNFKAHYLILNMGCLNRRNHLFNCYLAVSLVMLLATWEVSFGRKK